jgi:hypothetical protein
MIHVFKAGGDWSTADGTTYTIKSIKEDNKSDYLSNGWVSSLSEVKAEVEITGVDGGDYEREIREKLKSHGINPGGRAKIETMEKQLAEAEAKAELNVTE